MGNLQSILGDCQLGEMPAYLQQYVNKSPSGDEAYMVYGEKTMFQQKHDDTSGHQQQTDLYYSGPSQKYVRANLIEKKKKKGHVKSEEMERQVLSDLVDLCVDGIDTPEVRERPPLGSRAPGGATFAPPRSKKDYLNTEVWDEAEFKAESDGTLRATPGVGVTRVKTKKENEGSETNGKKKKHKASKKKKKKKTIVEETVAEIVDSYPGDIQDLLRDTQPQQDHVEEEYESDVKEEDQEDCCGSVSDDMRSVTSATVMSSPSKSTSDGPSVHVCREEEAKLFERLSIVVHPMEEPEEKPAEWYLLEAEWFREWSAFLRGGPRPSRIKNSKLLRDVDDEHQEPWPGLEPGKHYIGLDKVAWNLLKDIYGADISIERPNFDIYVSNI